MTFEYGTMDSQTILGSIKTLHITALENQGFQFGYASEKDERKVKRAFRELFYPASAAWRTKVMQDTRTVLKTSPVTSFEEGRIWNSGNHEPTSDS